MNKGTRVKCSSVKQPKPSPKSQRKCINKASADINQKRNKVNGVESINGRKAIANDCHLSSLDQDIHKLIELSKEFQKSCGEDKAHSSNVTTATTVKNWSCVTTEVRGKHYSNSVVTETDAIIKRHSATADRVSECAKGLWESVMPSVFDEQQMKDYGNRLVDEYFKSEGPKLNVHQGPIPKTNTRGRQKMPARRLNRLNVNIENGITAAVKVSCAAPKSARDSKSGIPHQNVLMNPKSRTILNVVDRNGQAIKKHSCVDSVSRICPKPQISARTREKYADEYYNFEKTHPNIELVQTNSIFPKRIERTPGIVAQSTPPNTLETERESHSVRSNCVNMTSKNDAAVKEKDKTTWHHMLSGRLIDAEPCSNVNHKDSTEDGKSEANFLNVHAKQG